MSNYALTFYKLLHLSTVSLLLLQAEYKMHKEYGISHLSRKDIVIIEAMLALADD